MKSIKEKIGLCLMLLIFAKNLSGGEVNFWSVENLKIQKLLVRVVSILVHLGQAGLQTRSLTLHQVIQAHGQMRAYLMIQEALETLIPAHLFSMMEPAIRLKLFQTLEW